MTVGLSMNIADVFIAAIINAFEATKTVFFCVLFRLAPSVCSEAAGVQP